VERLLVPPHRCSQGLAVLRRRCKWQFFYSEVPPPEFGRLPGSQRASVEIVTEPDVVCIEGQHIPLEWKPCQPTRGAQPLFRCPTCSRRCARLHSPPGGLFRCCKCWDLKYRVWNEGWEARTLRSVAQVGVPLVGAPVDGRVPLSRRERLRSLERRAHRARMRDALAMMALELLRKDQPSSAE
jgi:hypothetical protein